MRTEYKNNRKHVICSSLSEFFEEFKKYRVKKGNVAKKENYSEHVFPYLDFNKEASRGKDSWKLFLVDLDYEEPKTEPFWTLGLDISPANIKNVELRSEWDKKDRKIREVLHEIWEKGSTDTNSLDLNWPNVNEDNKENPTSSPTKPSDKVIWWIGGGVIFLLVYLFRKRKKISG